MSELDKFLAHIIIDSITQLIENHTIQQYFKYNIATYFELIAQTLESVNEITIIQGFLEKKVFDKNLIASENFLKYFLEILIPSFVIHATRNEGLFEMFSSSIQKVSKLKMFLM